LYKHKGDTAGTADAKVKMKHLKANPWNPFICPHLALIIRIISCGTYVENIWECEHEEHNFWRHLNSELNKLTEDELLSMGLTGANVGTHSIRKGGHSYGVSVPGFGGLASMALHCGWKVGPGKQAVYTYMTEGGSQNVASMLSGLNTNTVDFATLPMRFKKEFRVPINEILEDAKSFPLRAKFLIVNLLPCLVYHSDFVRDNLSKTDPFFRTRFWVDNWATRLRCNLLPLAKNYCAETGMRATGIPAVTRTMLECEELKNSIDTLNSDIRTEIETLKSVVLAGTNSHPSQQTLRSIQRSEEVPNTMLEHILNKITELSSQVRELSSQSSEKAPTVSAKEQWSNVLKSSGNVITPASDFTWPSKATVRGIYNLWYSAELPHKLIKTRTNKEAKCKSMAKNVVEFIDNQLPNNFKDLSIDDQDRLFFTTLSAFKIDRTMLYTSAYNNIIRHVKNRLKHNIL
jgi:hypothetical protein